jgi:Tfp pilus assembly protein PilN
LSFALNLASRPFRNERLPALLFGGACVLLLALTVQHALVAMRLLPGRTSRLTQEVDRLEADLVRIRAEAQSLRRPRPDKATVGQWMLVKELVDRRAFSWTTLLSRLESVLPRDVRLVSITPELKDNVLKIKINAISRTAEEGLALVGKLEARSEFAQVNLLSQTDEGEGANSKYEMVYLAVAEPEPAAPAGPEAAPASEDAPASEEAPAPEDTEATDHAEVSQ